MPIDPMPPSSSAVSTRSNTKKTIKAPTKSRVKSGHSSTSPSELADQLASGLTISNANGKKLEGKAKDSLPNARIDAMRAVNAASQRMSAVVESGWKASSSSASAAAKRAPASSTLSSVRADTVSVSKYLNKLREMDQGNINVERAAGSVVGKLLAMELYDLSLQILSDMHPRLCSLCRSQNSTVVSSKLPVSKAKTATLLPLDRLHLLAIPTPELITDTVLLTLASTYLLHALTALSHTILASISSPSFKSLELLSAVLYNDNSPTLLSWIPHLTDTPLKHRDTLLTRAYTALTKPSSHLTQINPLSVFRIRSYALMCLVHTSPGIVEPNTFWDQVIKFSSALIKSVPSPADPSCSEDVATKAILSFFGTLSIEAKDRTDKEAFMHGNGFVSFCEYWTEFAKRSSDIEALDRITSFMRPHADGISSNSGSVLSTVAESADGDHINNTCSSNGAKQYLKQDAIVFECTRICTILAQATAAFENKSNPSGDDLGKRIEQVIDTFKQCHSIFFSSALENGDEKSDVKRAVNKLERAIERLRRVAVKVCDTNSKPSRPSTPRLNDDTNEKTLPHKLLKSIVDFLVERISVSPELFTPLLETLFVLARTSLNPNETDTYNSTYDFLPQAAALLKLPEATAKLDSESLANYVRCVSGSFHNLAGILYQSGRYAHAVRFLTQGCELGVEALRMRSTNPGSERSEEGWKQLEEQLYRRWELLGVCYTKIGDHKMAYEAFIDCVRTYPFSAANFLQLARSQCPSAIFAASPSLKQIGGIIDRLTYVGACDLFQEAEKVSLKCSLQHADLCDAGQDIIGAVLERQVDSLHGAMWKHGISSVVKTLLKEVLQIYQKDQMPIRRARVLLRCLEFLYHVDPAIIANEEWSSNELGDEIESLLTEKDLGRDAGLQNFSLVYRAKARLWLTLHAHRRSDAQQANLAANHTSEACSMLLSMLALATSNEPKAKGVNSPKQLGAITKKGQGKAAVAKRAVAPSSRPIRPAVVVPVTPKQRKVSLNAVEITPPLLMDAPIRSTTFIDDLGKLLHLLHMVSHLLGFMGLTLVRLRLLDVIKRACQLCRETSDDGFVSASGELAHEYVKLGKTSRASVIYGQALHTIKNGRVSDEVRARFLLQYAHSLASIDNILRSSSMYCEALGLAEILGEEDKGGSTAQRIKARASRLERAAMAAHTFAIIQHSREDPTVALDGLLQSLRLWNRAADTLARLAAPAPSKVETDVNPFELTSLKNALPDSHDNNTAEQQPLKKQFPRNGPKDAQEWRIAQGMLSTLFALSQAYFVRGSPREAEYFAQQAHDLATSLDARAVLSRALARKSEVCIHQRRLEEGHESLVRAAELLQDIPGVVDAAEVQRLRGYHSQLSKNDGDARGLYEGAIMMLEELDKVFGTLDSTLPFGPRKSTGMSPKPASKAVPETLMPALLSVLLGRHIWLLRNDAGDEYKMLLERLLDLPSTPDTKAEENALMAKLTLNNVYARFRGDMFFSSLAESTIALPMGVSGSKLSALSPSLQEIVSALHDAEKLFWADLTLTGRRGSVVHIRDATVSLALIRALQSSLGKAGKDGPALATGLLDVSTAITLRREMLETIQHKFPAAYAADDLQWPLITPNGTPLPRPEVRRPLKLFETFDSDLEDDDDAPPPNASLKQYWETVRQRYITRSFDAASLSTSLAGQLPRHWTVVSVSVTEDKDTLFVARQCAGTEPLVFCVPLKGRRESEGGQAHLAFEDALAELGDIIRLSDDGTRRAVHVRNDDAQARAAWWGERKDLDRRMKELLENIEFCWLGAFKTILSPPMKTPPSVITELRTRLDKVFHRSLSLQDRKQKTRVKLDNNLLECFSTLSPKCRDEELEDLIYFILDLYQFHGDSIAIAEVDIDEVVVELRTALEEHAAATRGKVVPEEDSHMFLVLDKNVQGIPWESLPIMRGRSVSRIPSMDFLLDRLQLAKWQKNQRGSESAGGGEDEGVEDRIVVDPRKVYYILNPSGDLKATEGRFVGWVKGMERTGWEGVVGQAPSEQQFLDALSRNDLVIYFGHGGAEQYVRSHRLRHLPRCAVTMLWGCSSGALRDMGEFDRVGTPYNYILAGCPTLVANLWDVTDRDIDKFSQSVFDKMGLTAEHVGRWEGTGSMSIVTAVAESRDSCKLKYLTGSAPVVYGIPFYL